MSLQDIPYYRRRAIEENELAAASTEPRAARAHAELAKHYQALVDSAAMLPPTRAAEDQEQGELH
jgi:hypothetical protein